MWRAAAPRDISFSELRECLCSLDGVRELHDMRLWSLTTTKAALSVHLAIGLSACPPVYIIYLHCINGWKVGGIRHLT